MLTMQRELSCCEPSSELTSPHRRARQWPVHCHLHHPLGFDAICHDSCGHDSCGLYQDPVQTAQHKASSQPLSPACPDTAPPLNCKTVARPPGKVSDATDAMQLHSQPCSHHLSSMGIKKKGLNGEMEEQHSMGTAPNNAGSHSIRNEGQGEKGGKRVGRGL